MTVENSSHAPPEDNNSLYDSDDGKLRDSPLLKPMRPNLEPSPSPPPAVPLPQVSPDSSPGRKSSNRSKTRPSQGDAVLVSFMDGGKHPEIAISAGNEPLPSDDESSVTSAKGAEVSVGMKNGKESASSAPSLDLTALAAGALAAHAAKHAQEKSVDSTANVVQNNVTATAKTTSTGGNPMEDVVRPRVHSISTGYIGAAPGTGRAPLPASPETVVKAESSPPTGTGELPPIQGLSPQSGVNGGGTGPITLPGLRDQLGDINHLGEPAPTGMDQSFAQSPQLRHPPRFATTAAVPGQSSPPPLSPNDSFRRELPSPGRAAVGPVSSYYVSPNYRRLSQPDSLAYSAAGEYSSSNTETPSTDQSASTPAMVIDRMSIDGITNPQIGGFQCNYPGCTAQPFQTQYLLNSHANVHSSNRPHYCHVKGCPRSEGGKGFKRKNEMIRHGLVHDSPGYVCPFCPDREHKYPRPDNLQRHVRVHHVDKDKDDPQLREVLAQRPEGPSRGRRRRGGTT